MSIFFKNKRFIQLSRQSIFLSYASLKKYFSKRRSVYNSNQNLSQGLYTLATPNGNPTTFSGSTIQLQSFKSTPSQINNLFSSVPSNPPGFATTDSNSSISAGGNTSSTYAVATNSYKQNVFQQSSNFPYPSQSNQVCYKQ